MTLRAQLLRRLGLQLVLRGGAMLISFVVSVWVARSLGVEDFGRYSLALASVSVVTALALVGLHDVLRARLVGLAPEKQTELIRQALYILFGVGFLGYVGLVAWAVSSGLTVSEQWLVSLMGLSVLVYPFRALRAWFVAEQKVDTLAWLDLGISIFAAVFKIAALLLGFGLLGLAGAVVGEHVLTAMLYARHVAWKPRGRRPVISTATLRSWMQSGALATATIFAGHMYVHIDKFFLRYLLGVDAVGLYSAGTKVLVVWSLVSVILSEVLFRPFYDRLHRGSPHVTRELLGVVVLCLLFGGVGSFVIASLAPWIISTLFDSAYAGAYPVTRVAAFLLGPSMVMSVWYVLANAAERYMLILGLNGGVLAVNIALNIWLIPVYGIVGAGIASVGALAVGVLGGVALLLSGRFFPKSATMQ